MKILEFARRYLRTRGEPNEKGWIAARCPFHRDRSPSFGINIYTGVWNCFVCGSGSLEKLIKHFALQEPVQLGGRSLFHQHPLQQGDTIVNPSGFLPETILAKYPRYVLENFPPEISEIFDLRFDDYKKRILWPIRDLYGRLVGVSGRATQGGRVKYKVYTAEDLNVKNYSPTTRSHLFNLNRFFHRLFVGEVLEELIVVEGFKACAWVNQVRSHVVALMGSKITTGQQKILELLQPKKIIIFLDNNHAGWDGSLNFWKRLGATFPVFYALYPDEREQPDDLSLSEIEQAISEAQLFITIQRRLVMLKRNPQHQTRSQNKGTFVGTRFDPPESRKAKIRLIKKEFSVKGFNPATGQVETTIENYIWRRLHWLPQQKKMIVCSAGPNLAHPEPCIGCVLNNIWKPGVDGKRYRLAGLTDQYIIPLVELDWFHQVEQVNQNTGQPYTAYERCAKGPRSRGGRCEHCATQKPRVWGLRRIWQLSGPRFDELIAHEAEIERHCHCGGEIDILGFSCPFCSEILLTTENVSSDEELIQFGNSPHQCHSCGNTNYPQPIYGCSHCDDPRPWSIWDVDLRVGKVGRKPNISLSFGEFSQPSPLPYAPPDAEDWESRWEDLKSIRREDFEQLAKPTPIDEQLKIIAALYDQDSEVRAAVSSILPSQAQGDLFPGPSAAVDEEIPF